jgi:hypothetical protein
MYVNRDRCLIPDFNDCDSCPKALVVPLISALAPTETGTPSVNNYEVWYYFKPLAGKGAGTPQA